MAETAARSGALVAGGFDKRGLHSREGAYLERYRLKTRRAELGHWMAFAAAPLFVLWNPPAVAAVVVVYAAAANGPCIASQRYDRIRLDRVLARRRR